jgi:F0F1-type ATP synthase membrane subunit b/b'
MTPISFLEPFLTPILFIFTILVLLGGFLLIISIYKKEKEFEKKREGEFADYEKVLQQAHTNAEEIIHTAADEASQLSREGDTFAKHINQQVDAAFKEIIDKNIASLNSNSGEFLSLYQKSLEELKNKYEENITTILEDVHHRTQNDFSQLQEKIRQKTIDSQTGLTKQLEDEFEKTKIEITEYKKHKFQEVNKNMAKLVIRVSEEVLGQAIPLQQQQQLITDALERAQKEGVFDT